jgi:hypothetical protein
MFDKSSSQQYTTDMLFQKVDEMYRETLCWEEQLSNQEYLDKIDRKRYEQSQGRYKWVFHKYAEKVLKFSTVFPQLKIGKKTYVRVLCVKINVWLNVAQRCKLSPQSITISLDCQPSDS